MTPNRYNAIDRRSQPLHKKELKRGWHFCSEQDGALSRCTLLCSVACYPFGRRKLNRRLNALKKALRKDERRYHDRLCDLADANSY